MPNSTIEERADNDELHHDVGHPSKDIHIMPGIEHDSLLNIPKFANAIYIAIFDKDKKNIYNSNNTKVTVTCSTILHGWQCKDTKFWCVLLLPIVLNNNTDTVLCDRPPMEFLPERPLPTEAIHSVYKLKTQPKIVCYHHAAAGFPTKPTWLKAIKDKQYVFWPGLMANAVDKHYLESVETHKGNSRKTCSGLRSTKTTTTSNNDNNDDESHATHCPRPTTKQKTIFFKVYNLEDKTKPKMYTDLTGRLPKKSSRGHQYIMVLIEMDSNAILVAAIKNRLAGEKICAYQELVVCLCSAGIQPKLHLLDNECSAEFREKIKSNDMKYQLVSPHDHRQNIAGIKIKYSRHTSSASNVGATSPSHCTYGTDCSLRRNTH
jgi:hypothetical protein